MLDDGTSFQWLMDAEDWPGDFPNKIPDTEILSDVATDNTRTSSFNVPQWPGLVVDLEQEVPTSGYNIVQNYTFTNTSASQLDLKVFWMNDQDVEFAQTWRDNRPGFVLDRDPDSPIVYFIEDSDVAGPGNPGFSDRNHRIAVATELGGDISLDGVMPAHTPTTVGGATHIHFYAQSNHGYAEEFLNTVQEVNRCGACGVPIGPDDDNGDGLADDFSDSSAYMAFSLDLPPDGGSATLGFNYVGGSLSNSTFLPNVTGDFDYDGNVDDGEIDLLYSVIPNTDPPAGEFDLTGDAVVDQADVDNLVETVIGTKYGDANLDGVVQASTDGATLLANIGKTGVGWAGADFNGDGLITAAGDGSLLLAGLVPDTAAAAAVPEPGSLALLALAGLGLVAYRRRRA